MKASATSPWVKAFADRMERKLNENRHKGDRAGWARMSPRWLLTRLMHETAELSEALDGGTPYAIECECADVANFAMMIADVAGKMKPKGGSL